jgi:hypothetical protein
LIIAGSVSAFQTAAVSAKISIVTVAVIFLPWFFSQILLKWSAGLIDNEQRNAGAGVRAVTFRMVSNLIRHPFLEHDRSSVVQFRRHLTIDTIDDMPFVAPMIRQISWGIVDAAHADGANVEDFPCCGAVCARMLFGWDQIPIRYGKSYRRIDVHGGGVLCIMEVIEVR